MVKNKTWSTNLIERDIMGVAVSQCIKVVQYTKTRTAPSQWFRCLGVFHPIYKELGSSGVRFRELNYLYQVRWKSLSTRLSSCGCPSCG